MSSSSFFEKKEIFERGVAEVRTALRGRDVTTVPLSECGTLAKKYESLATLARELCELSRTAASKEQYTAYAVRLGERASTLKLLASGKSPKATPDEKRRQMLEEFEKRTQDIKKRLQGRAPEELTLAECEALAKKYEKLATLARSIANIARTETDEQKYSEFYERLMCRVAELSALARKKGKKAKQPTALKKAGTRADAPTQEPKPTQPSADAPTVTETPRSPSKAELLSTLADTVEGVSVQFESIIRAYQKLEAEALSDEEREEYAYFVRYFTESAELFEAVRKKEIKTLSPDEILSLQSK